jgi:hypothetical protein
MINRRNFLRTASAFAAGSMLLPASLSAKGINPYDIGLQLYTLRTSLERDFSGTLAQLARIGYRQVELYGYDDGKYFGLTVKEVKELLFKYRLRAPSGHYAYGLDREADRGEHPQQLGAGHRRCPERWATNTWCWRT